MRIIIELKIPSTVVVPTNYQFLSAAAYQLMLAADPVRAQEIHDDGYRWSNRVYKPFAFSHLTTPRHQRQFLDTGDMMLSAGTAFWHVASPLPEVISLLKTGILMRGQLEIGALTLKFGTIREEPTPPFASGVAYLSCMTPLVTTTRIDGKRLEQYLTPHDGLEKFNDNIRLNLVHKYTAIFGQEPDDQSLTLEFDRNYLRQHHGVQSGMYKDEKIVGTFAPFRAKGSPELLRMGFDCGFGQKNALGFGMVRRSA